MHAPNLEPWIHEHRFAIDADGHGERRTWQVVALTAVTMLVEIAAGVAYGSMALLADGWHMASHVAALGIAGFAYSFARRHAGDERFSFGTGKVGALAGFTSAIALALVALWMLAECVERLFSPVSIHFDQAILVATLGLVVNLACAWMLRGGHAHDGQGLHEHDHNLRAAYVHVLADGLTSALAILGLFAGRSLGWNWMDPLMGIAASVLIARWAVGLVRDTARVLLDVQVSSETARAIRACIESKEEARVVDLHLWRIAPRSLAAIISVVAHEPKDPEHYKGLVAGCEGLEHVTVEVNRCCAGERTVGRG